MMGAMHAMKPRPFILRHGTEAGVGRKLPIGLHETVNLGTQDIDLGVGIPVRRRHEGGKRRLHPIRKPD
jgi:hypothetical protein